MKEQIKNKANIKEKKVRKDYAGTEASPFREWLENKGDYNQEHDAQEPFEANPDGVAEEDGLYFQQKVEDERLLLIAKVVESLTEKQKEILRLCGNEGRTIENTAAILGISRGAVQTTLKRIREKVSVLQKETLPTNKRGVASKGSKRNKPLQ